MKKWLPWNNTVDNLSAITGTIQVRGGIIEAIQCQRDKHWQVNSHDVSELVGKPFPQQQSGLEQLFHDFPVDTEKAFLFNNIAKMMLDVL